MRYIGSAAKAAQPTHKCTPKTMDSEAAYSIDQDMGYEEEPADFCERTFEAQGKPDAPRGPCYLCTHSNAGLNSGGMKAQLDKIDAELCGRIEDEAIFALQAEWYKEHVYLPLVRHEPESNPPIIDAEACKRHYTFHSVNPRRMLKNDIQFLDNAQRFLQKNGILNKNRASGKLNMNLSFLKQWNILSRNKLDLLRYYRQEYLREEDNEAGGGGAAAEFSSF